MRKERIRPLKQGERINVKLGYNLLKILEKIVEQEKKKGFEYVSWATSGEILAKRIEKIGGLKEEAD